MPPSIRTRAMEYLTANPRRTASQVARGIQLPVGSVSSVLRQAVFSGHLRRIPNSGPRGGYTYELDPNPRSIPHLTLEEDFEIEEPLPERRPHLLMGAPVLITTGDGVSRSYVPTDSPGVRSPGMRKDQWFRAAKIIQKLPNKAVFSKADVIEMFAEFFGPDEPRFNKVRFREVAQKAPAEAPKNIWDRLTDDDR